MLPVAGVLAVAALIASNLQGCDMDEMKEHAQNFHAAMTNSNCTMGANSTEYLACLHSAAMNTSLVAYGQGLAANATAAAQAQATSAAALAQEHLVNQTQGAVAGAITGYSVTDALPADGAKLHPAAACFIGFAATSAVLAAVAAIVVRRRATIEDDEDGVELMDDLEE